AMLADQGMRAAHIAALADIASRYDGVELDYEHMPPPNKQAFTTFISELADEVHARGKMLSVAVYADFEGTSVYDYGRLASLADHVHIRGYGHYGKQPLPTAPVGWIEMVLAHVAHTGAAEKFSLGLPNYAFTPTSYCALGDCPSLCTGPIVPATAVLADGLDS